MIYFILSLMPMIILAYLKSKKSIHMLQQNFYDDDHRYLLWITRNLNKVFFTVDIRSWVLICCLFFIKIPL